MSKRRRELVGPEAKRSRSQSPRVAPDFKLPAFKPNNPLGETQTCQHTPILFKNVLSHFFLLFHRLHLQVRSSWSPHQGFSVISALFSTWTRASPRSSTAAARDTTTTCRYTQTHTQLNTQTHTWPHVVCNLPLLFSFSETLSEAWTETIKRLCFWLMPTSSTGYLFYCEKCEKDKDGRVKLTNNKCIMSHVDQSGLETETHKLL